MKRLRLGRHHKDLVYVMEGPDPSNDDRRFAVCCNERDAQTIVGWGNWFWQSMRVSEHWERGEVDEAKDYWREKLIRLDAMITAAADSPYPGLKRAADTQRPERQHLAVLLRTLGVDVPDLPEEGK